jgi:hypothetical protein
MRPGKYGQGAGAVMKNCGKLRRSIVTWAVLFGSSYAYFAAVVGRCKA